LIANGVIVMMLSRRLATLVSSKVAYASIS
jgi:hypothetical protein